MILIRTWRVVGYLSGRRRGGDGNDSKKQENEDKRREANSSNGQTFKRSELVLLSRFAAS